MTASSKNRKPAVQPASFLDCDYWASALIPGNTQTVGADRQFLVEIDGTAVAHTGYSQLIPASGSTR